MKKIFTTAAILLAAIQFSTAQNIIQVNYGYRNPIGSNIREAFRSTDGFSATLLHKGKTGKWAYGVSFNRQSFCSSNDYFSKDFSACFKNSNLLFSLRKDYKLKADHQLYWGIDAGMGLNKYKFNKAGFKSEERINAFTSGFILGADWFINKYFSLDVNGAYYRVQMDPVNFDDKFRSSSFKSVAFNIGLKFLM